MFKNYDTEFCKYLHLLGRENQDFLIENFKKIEKIEDLDNFGEEFGMIPPDGFFIDIKKQKENETVKVEDKLEENDIF